MSSLEREIERLRRALDRIGAVLDWPDERLHAAPTGSRWTAAMHAEHVLLADLDMLASARRIVRGEGERSGSPTLAGRIVLLTGRIPRGRGRAPERVLPSSSSERAALRGLLERNGAALAELAALVPEMRAARGRLRHAVFGGLTARQWLDYARVHSEHHLRILRG